MVERPYPSFLIYKDKAGEYRWRLQASNAKVIADSGEGYVKKSDCDRGIELVQASAGYPIWITEEAKGRG